MGKRIQLAIKRLMDVALAGGVLAALSPVMLTIAALIRLTMGAPVTFRQKRPGLNEKIFTLLKFRTMTDERDQEGSLLPDEKRLTRLGRFIRSSSLDELPQILNVLKGDMSLVGPRPLLVEYLDKYSPEQHRRHLVMPGVVGWAGVNGRNDNTWEKKFEYDIWYVDHWSIWLDLYIILKTILVVIKREGIGRGDSDTVSAFEGSNPADQERRRE